MKKNHNKKQRKVLKFIASNRIDGDYAEWAITSYKKYEEAIQWVIDALRLYNEEMGINFIDYDEMERKFRSELCIEYIDCSFSFQQITDEEAQYLLPFEYMDYIKPEWINSIE